VTLHFIIQSNFNGLSTFLKGVKLNEHNFNTFHYHEKGKSDKNYNAAEHEVHGLMSEDLNKIIFWVHNTSYWWLTEYKDNELVRKLMSGNEEKLKVDEGLFSYEVILENRDLDQFKALAPYERKECRELIKIKNLNRKTTYILEVFSTSNGVPLEQHELTSNFWGNIFLPKSTLNLLNANYGDFAAILTKKN